MALSLHLMAESSIALVVAYFGTLPNYFPLFLHTAARNPTIDFKFFGDVDMTHLDLPANVTFTPMALVEVAHRAEKLFGFKPVLPAPYKLCDYKAVYGSIFAPELRGYDFWGHCDIDTLLGDLRAFLTEERLQQYPRVFMTGHFAVYRNTDEFNTLFRRGAPGVDYRQVFRDPRNKYFDEWRGMYHIHLHHQIPFFHDSSLFADTWSTTSDLRMGEGAMAEQFQLFAWQNGQVLRLFESNGRVESQAYMHLHLQKRRLRVDAPWEAFYAAPRWYINGERIFPGAVELLTPEDLRRMNPRRPLRDFAVQAGRPYHRLRRSVREWRLLRQYPLHEGDAER